MKRRTLGCILGLGLVAWGIFPAKPTEPASNKVDFNRQIRPILSDNCFACHGPDEQQRQVGFRLDTRQGAFADRGGYRVIVPGNSAGSKLYQKIAHEDEIFRMPPPVAERKLNAEQIDLIRRWIDEGAKWEEHWAFVAPKRAALPEVKRTGWSRNPIDRFILARLEREGLNPSPEAEKATLLRRVTLDLTGLPPTPAEIDSFLADDSADAYEKAVDRLLASPHYGERMAMQWLDLARYADTHGYHIDSLRDMWKWRDWVIDAFNRNMPFDQFTVEQLAGDLLPNATLEQRIATGFNRNHMINFEGGAIPEEYRNEYLIDRLETTSTVWMGLTLGCARCHDHKYDPIKQKEFYQFYAYFNSVAEKGLDGKKGNARPFLRLPSDEQKTQLEELEQKISATRGALPEEKIAPLEKVWKQAALSTVPAPPRQGLVAHYEFSGHLADTSGFYRHGKTLRGEVNYREGRVATGAGFDGETRVALGAPAWERDKPFTLAFWMGSRSRKEVVVIQNLEGADQRRGFEMRLGERERIGPKPPGAHYSVRLSHRWPANAIQVRTKKLLKASGHVAITYDGSRKASGLKLYLGGKLQELDATHDNLAGSIQTTQPLEVGSKQVGKPFSGQLDDLRIYDRVLSAKEIEQLRVHEPIRGILASPLEGCAELIQRLEAMRRETEFDDLNNTFLQSKDGKNARSCENRGEATRDYYLTHAAPEELRKLHAELEKLEADKKKLDEKIPTTMVMQEREEPRETFILARGDYRNKTEKVSHGVPAVLSPMRADAPSNRLGLARWLVDPLHPLTARVTVNRYWQMHFGTGFVSSSENFGSQGEAPSHPVLLDWMAREFVRTGWDVKAMQKLIVTSAVYRQSSRATPELIERDPRNRLLARGSRFRIPAEMVRDNVLAVSGLLNKKIGGPSVYPYQPEGLWKEVAFGGDFTAQEYTPGSGEDLYRRSMYTVWKRTAPPPALVTFDAPDREKCVSLRSRTNTPLQALAMINDPTYVEAARALAERMMNEGGRDPARRIRHGFRLATARVPNRPELNILLDAARQQLRNYRKDKKAAAALLAVGESSSEKNRDVSEMAAWTTVASMILNLDETITKE